MRWYIKSASDSGVQHRVQATLAGHLVFDPACNFQILSSCIILIILSPILLFFFLVPFFWFSRNWQIGKRKSNVLKSRCIACKAASHPRMGISWCRKGVLRKFKISNISSLNTSKGLGFCLTWKSLTHWSKRLVCCDSTVQWFDQQSYNISGRHRRHGMTRTMTRFVRWRSCPKIGCDDLNFRSSPMPSDIQCHPRDRLFDACLYIFPPHLDSMECYEEFSEYLSIDISLKENFFEGLHCTSLSSAWNLNLESALKQWESHFHIFEKL